MLKSHFGLGLGLGLTSTAVLGRNYPRNSLFGVNISGAEYAPWLGQIFPTTAHASDLRTRKVGFVRLPISWESLQTSLGATLNATYLGKITSTIALLKSYGINTIVDIQNFGCYVAQAQWTTSVGYAGNAGVSGTGVSRFGDGTLTTANYTDMLTKLSTALKGLSGYIGLGIMNEPVVTLLNEIDMPNYFQPNAISFWFLNSSAVVTQLAAGTNPLGANYSPAWSLTSGTGFGSVAFSKTFTAVPYSFSCYAKVASGTQNLALRIGDKTSGDFTVTTSWQRFSWTATPTNGSSSAFIFNDNSAGVTIQIANAQLEKGASATAYQANAWLTYCQAGINAIRAVDTAVPLYVCAGGPGFDSPLASCFNQYCPDYTTLTDANNNMIFEAHQYFDGPQGFGGGGSYSGSYSSYSVTASTGSACISPFTTWLTTNSKSGFIGELGVPAGTDAASWLAVWNNVLPTIRAANIPCTGWDYLIDSSAVDKLDFSAANDARMAALMAA